MQNPNRGLARRLMAIVLLTFGASPASSQVEGAGQATSTRMTCCPYPGEPCFEGLEDVECDRIAASKSPRALRRQNGEAPAPGGVPAGDFIEVLECTKDDTSERLAESRIGGDWVTCRVIETDACGETKVNALEFHVHWRVYPSVPWLRAHGLVPAEPGFFKIRSVPRSGFDNEFISRSYVNEFGECQ